MLNSEKKLKEQLGIRETIKGYYEGCPSQHQGLRLLIEEGKGVQCLGCMQTFGKSKQDPESEWDMSPKISKKKLLSYYTTSGTITIPAGATAPTPVPGAVYAVEAATSTLQQQLAQVQQQMAQPAPPPDYGTTWDWAPVPGNPEPGN